MSGRGKKVPSYSRHTASGRAVVRIDGRDRYLGPYGSPESWENYERLIAEWRVGQRDKAESVSPAVYHNILDFSARVLATLGVKLPAGLTLSALAA